MLETIRDSAISSAEDKLRLFIIFYLSAPDHLISRADVEEFERVLTEQGANLAALQYVKK